MAKRVGRLHGLTQLALLGVAAGYWFVQIAQGAHFRELADHNRLRKLGIEAPRGLILDREGRPLVENVPTYHLYIDRSRSRDLQSSLRFAADILETEREELAETLETYRQVPSFKPVLLAEDLSLGQVAKINVEHLEHPELEVQVEHLRLYRHAHQTAHLLGYLGEVTDADLARARSPYLPGDPIGKKGVEWLYEDDLRGERGEEVVVVDSRGQRIEEVQRVPSDPGRDLRLTIDLEMQQIAAEQLEGKVGAIVALDPRNGEVLAMVSSPSFDPNRFARRLRREEWQELVENPSHPLQNRAIQNVYPPGSVFKIVMALAGLDLGVVDPATTRVRCNGFSKIYNHRFRCHKAGGHGLTDLRDSLKHSCNVFYHQLGLKLDVDQIADYAKRFGLGEKSGVDLDGERDGLVPSRKWSQERRKTPWYPGETISVSTGQGPILVTPLQVAVLTAAVANGGSVLTPRLVRSEKPPKARGLNLPAEHLERVRDALWSVVNEPTGTGRAARLDGVAIAGKTGTAQVITQETRTDNKDLPMQHRDHAWFTSYAPAESPELVVVVFVEHGGAGSQAAAPLAKALYERFFEHHPHHEPA